MTNLRILLEVSGDSDSGRQTVKVAIEGHYQLSNLLALELKNHPVLEVRILNPELMSRDMAMDLSFKSNYGGEAQPDVRPAPDRDAEGSNPSTPANPESVIYSLNTAIECLKDELAQKLDGTKYTDFRVSIQRGIANMIVELLEELTQRRLGTP